VIAVDSSAIMAVLLEEPDAARFVERIARPEQQRISVANVLELHIAVLHRTGQDGARILDRFLAAQGLVPVAVETDQLAIAREAFDQYGKGRHPAALNFGDCFAYALAKRLEVPPLFKGTDFQRTDVKAVDLVGP
jgi:ribonuclease VapC